MYEEGSCSSPQCDRMRVLFVSKSKSERLLEKYFDSFEFDFEYEKSGIWSPPVRRTTLVGPPDHGLKEDEVVGRLRSVWEVTNGGVNGKSCFHVWGCVASLFTSFQKRVKRRKEIGYSL